MKHVFLLGLGLMASGSVLAADLVSLPDVTTSGSAALASDYLFRGVSQTSNNAAAQAGMTFAHKSGVYFSLWGSSIASGFGGLELDTLLGYSAPLTLGSLKSTVDVGVMRYNYPGWNKDNNGGGSPDYNELYGSLKVEGVGLEGDALKGGFAYSNDYFNSADQFWYVYSDYSAPLGSLPLGLVAHVGYNKFNSDADMSKALGTALAAGDNYVDYKLGTTFGVLGTTAELAWIGSNISKDDCGGKLCEGRAVLTVTKSF
jgi:uncharacterized protein (TIGR02001 family)